MGRKQAKINIESGKRLSLILSERNMQQKELAEAISYTPQQISRIIKGKSPMTEEFAHTVVERFRAIDREAALAEMDKSEMDKSEMVEPVIETIRYEWLMCYDDFKTEGERISYICKKDGDRESMIEQLIKLHGYSSAFETWDGRTCYLQYPPGISDEEALKRIHETYPEPIISITAPTGAIRWVDRCEYRRIVKNIDDYIEMQLSFLFRRPKDGAKEYWG